MSDTIKKMKIHFSEIMALVLPNHLEKKFYMKFFFVLLCGWRENVGPLKSPLNSTTHSVG